MCNVLHLWMCVCDTGEHAHTLDPRGPGRRHPQRYSTYYCTRHLVNVPLCKFYIYAQLYALLETEGGYATVIGRDMKFNVPILTTDDDELHESLLLRCLLSINVSGPALT